MTVPLTSLLKKVQRTCMVSSSELEATALERLIAGVQSFPSHALPNQDLPFSVDIDASGGQIGAVFFKVLRNNVGKTTEFLSQSLTKAERSNSMPKQGCLMVVLALRTFTTVPSKREIHVPLRPSLFKVTHRNDRVHWKNYEVATTPQ